MTFSLPDGAVLTRRDFVNTWECDENGHWNVQFYARAFEHAAEIAAALCGRSAARTDVVRHVRYHRELRVARSMDIHSVEVADGPHAGAVAHLLTEVETGALAATAIDMPTAGRFAPSGLPCVPAEALAPAMPRGLSAGAEPPADIDALLANGRAVVGHYGVVRRGDTDEAGRLLFAAVVSRFTDSASHVWSHAGIGEEWLTRTGHGRVAVEMKLTMRGGAAEGEALRMVSWIDDMEEKTFSIRHQLEDIRSRRLAAQGAVRALVMNLETRRAVALPAEMRAFHKRAGGMPG